MSHTVSTKFWAEKPDHTPTEIEVTADQHECLTLEAEVWGQRFCLSVFPPDGGSVDELEAVAALGQALEHIALLRSLRG